MLLPSSDTDERSWLDRLDARLVPPLQAVARRGSRRLARIEERAGPLFRFPNRHRGLIVLTAAAIVAASSFLHLQRYTEVREAEQQERATAARQDIGTIEGTGPADPGEADAVAVGPPVGGDLEAYLTERREVLGDLPPGQTRTAVVSFAEYRTPEAAAAALPAGLTPLAVQYRLPGSLDRERPLRTEVVGGQLAPSVQRAVDAALADIEQEMRQVESTLQSEEGLTDDFAADYRARLDELEAIANLLRSEAQVVFAVVVRGEAGTLQDLAGRGEVRLVDVAPAEVTGAEIPLFGVLPEDGAEATFGRTAAGAG